MYTKSKRLNFVFPIISFVLLFFCSQNVYSQTIQAEDYIAMDGIQTQATSDAGGVLNVGWFDYGDWVAYNVNIPSTGTYTVSYRVASRRNTGKFQLEGSGGSPIYGTLDVPYTGGWQKWKTISHDVNLQGGEQVIAIAARGDGFNINWFNISAKAGNEADPTITYLFENSYQVFKKMRLNNGIYLDAMSINAGDKPAAIAGNGIGLMALCIADAMYQKTNDAGNWESNAEGLAATTIQTFVDFKNNGKTNQSGMFYRYFNPNNGDPENYEFSTIDNAIFAIGLTMCKNRFSWNSTLVNNVNYLMGDMDYPDAISSGNGIYMVLDWDGNGSAATVPFNEYMLVSWMANLSSTSNPGHTRANNHWNTYFANPVTAPITHPNYGGYELLSDGGFCSSFTVLFCYYFVNYFKNNGDYMWYLDNWRKADMQYQGGANYEWGLGAGENPGGGYSANAINNNPDNIVSPHIIAGFLPIYSQGKEHLKSLYNNGNGPAVYTIPGTNRKFLWRYSRNNTGLRCSYVQAVDFSTMLFGLASLPEYLGDQFFNSLNYPSNLKSGSIDFKKRIN